MVFDAAGRRQAVELRFSREFGVENDATGATGTRHHFGQTVIGLRPQNDVDERCPCTDFSTLGLRDAARNGDDHRLSDQAFLLLDLAQAAEFGKDLLGGLFANVAGIQDDHVRTGHITGQLIAERRQDIRHAGGVVHVHLTAVGLYVELFGQGLAIFTRCIQRCEATCRSYFKFPSSDSGLFQSEGSIPPCPVKEWRQSDPAPGLAAGAQIGLLVMQLQTKEGSPCR